MTYTYVIPGRLGGANEAINAARTNKYAGAKEKHSETQRCALAAIAGKVPRIQKPILVHFHWFEPSKRRDLDNIRFGAKYILDGLQESGRLPNDGWDWVRGMSDTFSVDKDNPRVEVTLMEVPLGD